MHKATISSNKTGGISAKMQAPPEKKRKKNDSNGQMNHLMYGEPRGPLMGPGDMYRPSFGGGHGWMSRGGFSAPPPPMQTMPRFHGAGPQPPRPGHMPQQPLEPLPGPPLVSSYPKTQTADSGHHNLTLDALTGMNDKILSNERQDKALLYQLRSEVAPAPANPRPDPPVPDYSPALDSSDQDYYSFPSNTVSPHKYSHGLPPSMHDWPKQN